MSLENLEAVLRPATLRTKGINWREHTLTFDEDQQPRGDFAVQEALHKIFSIKSFRGLEPITCWYDVLRDVGDKNHYLYLKDVHMMGVLYTGEFGCKDEDDIVTHFFIRKLDGFRGPLDRWRDDLKFPRGTRKFSVCAVLPKGFEMPERGLRDPHNHAVTQFTWERMAELGVSMPDILDYISYVGFSKD